MRIFVTGAGGMVGRKFVKTLMDEGWEARGMIAPFEDPEGLKALGCEVERADITDRDALREAFGGGADYVAHLVGILVESRHAKFDDIHVKGTQNLVDVCKEKGDVRRILFTSAYGAAPDAESKNHRTQWQAEEIIRFSGIPYTILRPTIIFGKEDRFTNKFAYWLRHRLAIVVPGEGSNRVQPVYVEDVAKALDYCLKSEETANRVFDIAGSDVLTYDEMVDRIADVVGERRHKTHVPIPLLYAAGYFAERLFSKPPLTRDLVTMIKEDYVTPHNALTEVFHMKPKGFVEGMKEYLH